MFPVSSMRGCFETLKLKRVAWAPVTESVSATQVTVLVKSIAEAQGQFGQLICYNHMVVVPAELDADYFWKKQ